MKPTGIDTVYGSVRVRSSISDDFARLTFDGGYEPALTLPSGGDTSYAGMVWHEGLLWVSYYSSHEGKSAIYLAKVKVTK